MKLMNFPWFLYTPKICDIVDYWYGHGTFWHIVHILRRFKWNFHAIATMTWQLTIVSIIKRCRGTNIKTKPLRKYCTQSIEWRWFHDRKKSPFPIISDTIYVSTNIMQTIFFLRCLEMSFKWKETPPKTVGNSDIIV